METNQSPKWRKEEWKEAKRESADAKGVFNTIWEQRDTHHHQLNGRWHRKSRKPPHHLIISVITLIAIIKIIQLPWSISTHPCVIFAESKCANICGMHLHAAGEKKKAAEPSLISRNSIKTRLGCNTRGLKIHDWKCAPVLLIHVDGHLLKTEGSRGVDVSPETRHVSGNLIRILNDLWAYSVAEGPKRPSHAAVLTSHVLLCHPKECWIILASSVTCR